MSGLLSGLFAAYSKQSLGVRLEPKPVLFALLSDEPAAAAPYTHSGVTHV